MDGQTGLKLRLELLWWLFTAILIVAVLLPLWLNGINYPFVWTNILFIIIFVTFTRYIFLLKHTLWARKQWPKLLILAGSVILFFIIIMSLGDFNNYLEEVGLQTIVNQLPQGRQYRMIRYIQTEALFFGVGSAIATMLFPIRMLISIWRIRNTPNMV